jgi:hypothetical protein
MVASSKSRSLSAISGDRSSATRARPAPVGDRLRLLAQLLHLGQRQHLVGQRGGAVHRGVDLDQRLLGSTSPRRADCTCAFSTASGVRSWWALSRTKRFWWSSSRCEPRHHLVGGVHQRQQLARRVGRVDGRQVALGRPAARWLRRAPAAWRAARRPRPPARSPATSSACCHSVSSRILRASVRRSSSVSATCTTAMPRPRALATGCSSTATRTGWSRKRCRRSRPAPHTAAWSGMRPRQNGRSAKPDTISPRVLTPGRRCGCGCRPRRLPAPSRARWRAARHRRRSRHVELLADRLGRGQQGAVVGRVHRRQRLAVQAHALITTNMQHRQQDARSR